jgi:sn-glycerol 3-phosphate transport system substrate-binding protein
MLRGMGPLSRRLRVPLIAVGALALVAGACGGGDDGDGGGGAAASGECPFDALESAEGPIEIDLWHTEIGLNEKALQKIVDEYEASQDKVQVNLQFQGTFEEQLKKYEDASADPASLPDIVSPDDTVTQYMADSGTVIPVQSCIDADPDAKEIYDDMVPIVEAAYSIEDVLWPGAFAAAGAVTYINEAHFEAAGLDPEADQPQTLDQLREVAEKIKAANIAGVTEPLVMRIEAWPLEFLTSGALQPVVDEDNGRAGLATSSEYANDVTLEILEFLNGMVDDGLLKYTDNADLIAPYLAMATESSSMLIDSSSSIRTVDGAIQGTLTPDQLGLGDEAGDLSGFSFPTLRLTVGELPGLTEPGKGQMGGAAWYLVAGEDDTKVAAAWDFMKFFNQTEQQVTWAVEGSSFPVRTSATESPELQAYWTDTQPGRWMAEAYKGFTTLDPEFPGPVIGPYREFRLEVKNGLEAIVLEGAEPADAMEQVDQRFQEALDEYAADVGA